MVPISWVRSQPAGTVTMLSDVGRHLNAVTRRYFISNDPLTWGMRISRTSQIEPLCICEE